MHVRFMALVAAAAAIAVSLSAHAQQYPSGPVKLVVPFSAGSSTDVIGREVARSLGEQLHQTFVVENRPGAQSTIGAREVARAAPDGYTLLLGSTTSIAAAPFLLKNIQYHPLTDFAPVARVGAVVFVLVTRADLPVKSVADLIEYGRKNPGKLNWGYANAANQASAASLTHYAKIEATAVSYTGVPQLLVDMLGDRLDFAIIDTTNAGPQIKAGKIRALAVTTKDELPTLPGVPPLGKTIKGFELVGWYGVYAPAHTPPAVISILSKAVLKGLEDPGMKQRIATAGLVTYPADSAGLGQFAKEDTARWAQMVKAANIQPQ
jgi:tripartite-type tricarboxylate transporter receptor subunit TctC